MHDTRGQGQIVSVLPDGRRAVLFEHGDYEIHRYSEDNLNNKACLSLAVMLSRTLA